MVREPQEPVFKSEDTARSLSSLVRSVIITVPKYLRQLSSESWAALIVDVGVRPVSSSDKPDCARDAFRCVKIVAIRSVFGASGASADDCRGPKLRPWHDPSEGWTVVFSDLFGKLERTLTRPDAIVVQSLYWDLKRTHLCHRSVHNSLHSANGSELRRLWISEWSRNATRFAKGAKLAAESLGWLVPYFAWRAANFVHEDMVRWRYPFSNELIHMATAAIKAEIANLDVRYFDHFDGFREPVRDGVHPAESSVVEAMDHLLFDAAKARCRNERTLGKNWAENGG